MDGDTTINFYNIGCIFGKILSVKYSKLDCAKVTILIDCLFQSVVR